MLPREVAEGFAQTVTRHARLERKFFRGGADNAVGLDTTDCFAGAGVDEDRFAGFRGGKILPQRGDNLIVELDDF